MVRWKVSVGRRKYPVRILYDKFHNKCQSNVMLSQRYTKFRCIHVVFLQCVFLTQKLEKVDEFKQSWKL